MIFFLILVLFHCFCIGRVIDLTADHTEESYEIGFIHRQMCPSCFFVTVNVDHSLDVEGLRGPDPSPVFALYLETYLQEIYFYLHRRRRPRSLQFDVKARVVDLCPLDDHESVVAEALAAQTPAASLLLQQQQQQPWTLPVRVMKSSTTRNRAFDCFRRGVMLQAKPYEFRLNKEREIELKTRAVQQRKEKEQNHLDSSKNESSGDGGGDQQVLSTCFTNMTVSLRLDRFARLRKQLQENLDRLEHKLRGKDFLVGVQFRPDMQCQDRTRHIPRYDVFLVEVGGARFHGFSAEPCRSKELGPTFPRPLHIDFQLAQRDAVHYCAGEQRLVLGCNKLCPQSLFDCCQQCTHFCSAQRRLCECTNECTDVMFGDWTGT